MSINDIPGSLSMKKKNIPDIVNNGIKYLYFQPSTTNSIPLYSLRHDTISIQSITINCVLLSCGDSLDKVAESVEGCISIIDPNSS